MNCWNRYPKDTNPAHWLMKVHKLFELAQVAQEVPFASLETFDSLALHQCASYDRVVRQSLWPWGKFIFQVATSNWLDAGLWKGSDRARIIELNLGDRDWSCFEDLVFETQYGNWFPAMPYIFKWQQSLLETVGLPKNITHDEGLAQRCRTNRLRIHVFKRTEGRGLRDL